MDLPSGTSLQVSFLLNINSNEIFTEQPPKTTLYMKGKKNLRASFLTQMKQNVELIMSLF